MRAIANQSIEGKKHLGIWEAEKAKMSSAFSVFELNENDFNSFCDEIEQYPPEFFGVQGINPRSVREMHCIIVPSDQAESYHFKYGGRLENHLIVMLADDDKAKYCLFRLFEAFGMRFGGCNGQG